MDDLESSVRKQIQGDDRPKSIVHHDLRFFTEIELESITSNYRTMVGKGGFGEVFEGVLEDGSMVAVKRLIRNVEESFAKELDVHRAMCWPSSIHGNIKSSNVLLEDSHAARVSEHGLGTLTAPKASGYGAPEVTEHSSRHVSQKADVYSLGLLMLELFTRKAPACPSEEGVDLLRLVSSVDREKWVAQVLDAQLRLPDEETEHMILQLLQLAIDCCSHSAHLRPSMPDVRDLLHYFLRKTMLSVPSL